MGNATQGHTRPALEFCWAAVRSACLANRNRTTRWLSVEITRRRNSADGRRAAQSHGNQEQLHRRRIRRYAGGACPNSGLGRRVPRSTDAAHDAPATRQCAPRDVSRLSRSGMGACKPGSSARILRLTPTYFGCADLSDRIYRAPLLAALRYIMAIRCFRDTGRSLLTCARLMLYASTPMGVRLPEQRTGCRGGA